VFHKKHQPSTDKIPFGNEEMVLMIMSLPKSVIMFFDKNKKGAQEKAERHCNLYN